MCWAAGPWPGPRVDAACSGTLQDVQVGHGDAAEHGADDAEKALVGSCKVEVVEVGAAFPAFFRSAIDGSVQVAGVFAYCARGEHVLGQAVRVERERAFGEDAEGDFL